MIYVLRLLLEEDDVGKSLVADRLLWFASASLLASQGTWGVVWLADSFRPNVSVSRDLLLNLPLHVHSAIDFAAFRARCDAYRGKHVYPFEILNHFTTPDGMLLGSLLADPLMTSGGGWRSEPVFKTDAGRKTLGEIRQATAKGYRLQLQNVRTPSWFSRSEYTTFMDACVAAMAQIGLPVELEQHSFNSEFFAVPGEPMKIEEGHKLFPPLTFLPFKNTKVAMNPQGILNANHDFAKWLVEAAPTLNQKYPGILKSIRKAVLNHSFQAINKNLERLTTIAGALRPPKSVFLSKTDVEGR
jgi:hypothetical protein